MRVATQPKAPPFAQCVDCGKPIRPPALRCRTHAAAEARRVRDLLHQSGEIAIQDPLDDSTTSADTESEWGIFELGVKLAYTIASAVDPSARALYLRLLRKTLVPVWEIDSRHLRIGRSFALAEHPFMAEAVAAREPRMGMFAATPPGRNVRDIATRISVVGGIAVPVTQGSLVHGILAIGWRSAKASDNVLEGLIDIGRLLELALANRS